MKKILILILTTIVVFASGPKVEYTHKGYTTRELALIGENNAKEINFVTIEQIKESLANTPSITVSFDIDDTTLVSSPCFFNGKKEFGNRYLSNQEYWDYLGKTFCDKFSMPKISAKELIKMHLERGDTVIFITGRTAQKGYTGNELDDLGKYIKEEFNIPDMKPVNYRTPETKAANKYDKTYYIKKYNVSIHYGDSDDDILAAREAGIRGIRVLRTTTSTNLPMPSNGGYGEEVVYNSSY